MTSPRRAPVLGVIGPGDEASESEMADAFEIGALAAGAGWVVLTGGRAAGVMDAASRGARSAGGIAVGVLPDADATRASPALDVAIVTALGEMRDHVVVQSSDAIVVCGMNPGTAAETALALKARKPLILLRPTEVARAFFQTLADRGAEEAATPAEAVDLLVPVLGADNRAS